MFYQQLIALCEREGVKPTPLIKSLGFSAGNIKRWENGATVNSDILLAIAKHFKVSIDYLLTGQEDSVASLTSDEQKLLENYSKLTNKDKEAVSSRAEELANGIASETNEDRQDIFKYTDLKEKEMFTLFRRLSEYEQIKLIGRAEILAEQAKLEESVG